MEKFQKILLKLNDVKEKIVFGLLVLLLGWKIFQVVQQSKVGPGEQDLATPAPMARNQDTIPTVPKPRMTAPGDIARLTPDIFKVKESGTSGATGTNEGDEFPIEVRSVQKAPGGRLIVILSVRGKREQVEKGKAFGSDFECRDVRELSDKYEIRVYSKPAKKEKTLEYKKPKTSGK